HEHSEPGLRLARPLRHRPRGEPAAAHHLAAAAERGLDDPEEADRTAVHPGQEHRKPALLPREPVLPAQQRLVAREDVAGLPPAVDELPDERRLVRPGPVDLHAAEATKRSIAGSDVSSSIAPAGMRTPNSVSSASISSRWRSESQPGTSSL